MKNTALALAAASAAIAFATPALAVPVVVPAPACSNSDISPAAVDCAGWYDGNLLNGTAGGIQAQKDALALIGFIWDGLNWAALDAGKILPTGGNNYNFPGLLNGDTWVGIHKGKGEEGWDGTAFFRLNASNLDSFNLQFSGGSSAVLYSSSGSVPEPATWAFMILGFGAVGAAMRRRQQVKVTYA